jgi:hypothetical protein
MRKLQNIIKLRSKECIIKSKEKPEKHIPMKYIHKLFTQTQ